MAKDFTTRSTVAPLDPSKASNPIDTNPDNESASTESGVGGDLGASAPTPPEAPAPPAPPAAPVAPTPPAPPAPPAPPVAPKAPAPKVGENPLGVHDHIRAEVSRTEGHNGTCTKSIEGIIDLILTQPSAFVKVAPAHAQNVLQLIETTERTKKFATISDVARAKVVRVWKLANSIE